MKYIISVVVAIVIVLFVIYGFYYPTSYRAFIPKYLDSEHKEFERLCKEEMGKVVYARPVGKGVRLEDVDSGHIYSYKISNNISIKTRSINTPELVYIYIAGVKFYPSWNKTYIIKGDDKQYMQCEPLIYGRDLDEECAIVEKMAFDNKEYIGKKYEERLFSPNRIESDIADILRKITNFNIKESK